ncbi:MAG: Bug family tripartite tricarboxylate transporter substrate binding protein [bacterium]|jgi:tripartite-type tricarboxylate transporter receptor subunit TctC|nr:tripartite tricarboxylate transporter substrate binding protein [Betaproteobacteria bacterium]
MNAWIVPAAMGLAAMLPAAGVGAQQFPVKPLRLVVPSGPGGGLDLIGRSVVALIGDSMGQPVVVENRAGAGGDIATEFVARARADGYTLLMASATFVVRAHMYRVPYDPLRDFSGVAQVSTAPYAVVVHASLPVRSIRDLIAHAKGNPGKLNFGSQGEGSLVHLVGELIKSTARIDMVHVPYKGAGAAFADLLANQVQLGILTLPSALPYTKSDRLRALATTGRERAQAAPDIPTMIESGVPDFAVTQWHAVLAPRGTPVPVVERLNREILQVLRQSDTSKNLAREGAEIVGSSPQAVDALIRSEHDRWGRLVKSLGLRQE